MKDRTRMQQYCFSKKASLNRRRKLFSFLAGNAAMLCRRLEFFVVVFFIVVSRWPSGRSGVFLLRRCESGSGLFRESHRHRGMLPIRALRVGFFQPNFLLVLPGFSRRFLQQDDLWLIILISIPTPHYWALDLSPHFIVHIDRYSCIVLVILCTNFVNTISIFY